MKSVLNIIALFALFQVATIKTVSEDQADGGRINPQLSCTVEPDDKQLLNDLCLYVSNQENRPFNISVIIRALIRLGSKHRHELIREVRKQC